MYGGIYMDQIAQWISYGYHITDDEKLSLPGWEDFERGREGKKVFVFGAGEMAAIFLNGRGKGIPIEGIVDNDSRKHGQDIDDILKFDGENITHRKILSVSDLMRYSPENTLVLIASSKYYESIAKSLENIGYKNYYSMLNMEYNEYALGNSVDKNADEKKYAALAEKYAREEDIQPKKIVFWTMGILGNHEKYIAKALLKIRSDLDVVWAASDISTPSPTGVRPLSMRETEKCIYEMETAKVWVSGAMIPGYFVKREGQTFIETNHCSFPIKKFYLDAPSVYNAPGNFEWWTKNARMIDYVVVTSEFHAEASRRGFGERAKMLYFGSPRSDALFSDEDYRKKIGERYSLSPERPILLYAPTYRFRRDGSYERHIMPAFPSFSRIKEALKKYSGEEWYILLRLHPGIQMAAKGMEFPEYVIDASDYEDSQEMVASVDMIISDFSTIMFDAAFIKKPMLLYASDRDEYLIHDYELLMDYDSLPFSIAVTEDELAENIEKFDRGKYEKNVAAFLEKYGLHEDGEASERTARFISEIMPI